MPVVAPAFVALIVLLLSASPREADGQRITDARLSVGVPLRLVTLSERRETVLYAGQSESGLTIRRVCRDGCDGTSTIPWDELAQVDARVTQGHSAGWSMAGVLMGAAGGFAAAFIAANVTNAVAPCHWDEGSCPVLGFIVLGPAIIATGAAVGGVLGWHHESYSWTPVWPPSR
jgi:hypothetical protein